MLGFSVSFHSLSNNALKAPPWKDIKELECKTENNERNERPEKEMIPLQKLKGSCLVVESFQLDADKVLNLTWTTPLFCLFLTTCKINFASPTAQERCGESWLLSCGDAGRNRTLANWLASEGCQGHSRPAEFMQLTGHHWSVGKRETGWRGVRLHEGCAASQG